MSILITYTTIILASALIGGYIASRFNQYIIVGYIIIGLILGSFVISSHSSQSYLNSLAYIGVALLVFSNGTEFSLSKILNYKKIIITGTILQTLLTSLILTVIFLFFGLTIIPAFVIGSAFAMSSTIIVTKVLKDLDRNYSQEGEITFSWLMVQDILTIPLLVFLTNLNISGGNVLIPILIAILKSILIFLILYYLGLIIIPYILAKIAKTEIRELLILAVISILFIIIVISSYFGISPIIAAFMAGLIISKGMMNHQIASEIKPFKDLFSVFFFVLIGAVTPLSFIIDNFFMIILIALLIIFIKVATTYTELKIYKFHSMTSFIVALNMFQAGEFSFVIGTVAYQGHIISAFSYHILLSVTILTMILTPVMIKRNTNIYDKLNLFIDKHLHFLHSKLFDRKIKNSINKEKHKEIIIAGYGRVGRQIVDILKKNNVECSVIDFNKSILEEHNSHNLNFIYGNADSIDILKVADILHAKIMIITTPDIEINYKIAQISKSVNPAIKIIARSHLPHHKDILLQSGVEYVIEPEKETAITIADLLLRYLGKGKADLRLSFESTNTL